MVPSIVVLSTPLWNTKTRSSKLIFKSNAPKQMTKSGFGCGFLSLNLKFVFIFLEFIRNLRSSSSLFFVENHQFNVILSYFLKKLDDYLFNITTCTIFYNMQIFF